jgi:cytochrome oxidase Cu insertion factor (SCO1/SenC/PrrC family)
VVTSLKTMEHSDAGGSAAMHWILITVVVLGSLLAAIWLRPTDQDQIPGYTPLIERNLLGPFELTHHDGHPINSDFFAGDWTLVFFGFTHCPDVCPTTLSVLNKVVGVGRQRPAISLRGS